MTEFGFYEYYKHSFQDSEEWKKVSLLKRDTGRRTRNVPDEILAVIEPELYGPRNIPIKREKYENLMELMKFVPLQHQGFYRGLQVTDANSD